MHIQTYTQPNWKAMLAKTIWASVAKITRATIPIERTKQKPKPNPASRPKPLKIIGEHELYLPSAPLGHMQRGNCLKSRRSVTLRVVSGPRSVAFVRWSFPRSKTHRRFLGASSSWVPNPSSAMKLLCNLGQSELTSLCLQFYPSVYMGIITFTYLTGVL